MDPQRLTLVPYGGDERLVSKASIISIFPFPPVNETRPGMPWVNIPACLPGMEFVKYVVTDRSIPTDRGDVDGTFIDFVVTARAIAHDLIRDVKEWGVFVAAGDDPTPAELAAARADLLAYARKMIVQGDQIWQQYGKRQFISKHSIWAVQFLNQKREWAFEQVTENKACPSCQQGVPVTAARCAHCRAVLDWNRAAAVGVLDGEERKFGMENDLIEPAKVKEYVAAYRAAMEAQAAGPGEEIGDDAVTDEEAKEDELTPEQRSAARARAAKAAKRLGRTE